jgi:hypothetical protein
MLQPTIDLTCKDAIFEWDGEATWPVFRLKWPDYPDAFADFIRSITKDNSEISRVDIAKLRVISQHTKIQDGD